MTKYGTCVCFGYCVRPSTTEPRRPLRLATYAESLGLDYISVQEMADEKDRYDLWTLMTAIGIVTSRISLIIAGDDFKQYSPTVLAKAVASLDLLTNGRVEIEMSASPNLSGDSSAGDGEEVLHGRLRMQEEAIKLLRMLWSGRRPISFRGKYFALDGIEPGPTPAHRNAIWLKGREQPAMELVGTIADGWIADTYQSIEMNELASLSAFLDQSLENASRQPSDVRRMLKIHGRIGDEESAVPFQGTAHQWADLIAALAVETGIDTFLLMEDEDAEEQLAKFALEVIPKARATADLAPAERATTGLANAHQGFVASGPTPIEEENENLDWVDTTSMESFPASDPPGSASFT